jgi:hypothetical protein
MRLPLLLLVLCAAAGCTTAQPGSGYALAGSSTRAWLAAHLKKSDTVVFISHNGVAYGADADAKIAFKRNRAVEVTVLGYVQATYTGTWSVDGTGLIGLDLRDYPGPWPGMRLYPDGNDALLYSMAGGANLGAGSGPAPGGLAGMNPFWPFRYISH